MIPTRIVFIPVSAALPAKALLIGADGQVVAHPDLTLEGAGTLPTLRTIAVAPGADAVVRRIALPVGAAAQARAAALWKLREDVAATPDRLSVALGAAPRTASDGRMTAVVAPALVQAWTDYLASLGVKVEAIVPDCLILPEPEADDLVLTRPVGADLALRGQDLAATVQPEFAAALIGDRRAVPATDAMWTSALATMAASPPLDLRPAVSLREGGAVRWRAAAILAVALLASPLVLDLAGGWRDRAAAEGSNTRASALIADAAPDLAGTSDPVGEVRRRGEAALPAGVSGAAASLFAAVEAVEGAEIDALSSETARGMNATISYAAFQDLDAIKRAMAGAGYALIDESTVEDGGRVVSGVRIGSR